jgi:hypothetical protein
MGAGLNLFFAKNHSPSSPRIAPRPRPPNAPAPPREARKHPDTQCERCRGKPSFSAERLEEGQRRRLVSRAGARRSLNGGGGWIFFLGGAGVTGVHKRDAQGTVHTQGYACAHTGVHRCTKGSAGYTGVHMGARGNTGAHRRTHGCTRGTHGYTRGTQGVLYAGVLYTGVLYSTQGYYTQGYTGVHRGTQGYTGVHRGTQGYTGVHRGTQGYTGVHRGVHTQGCSEAHRQKPLSG